MITINCPECANYFKSELTGEGQTCYCKECGRTYEIELLEIWKNGKQNKFKIKSKKYWIDFLSSLEGMKIHDIEKLIKKEIDSLKLELDL